MVICIAEDRKKNNRSCYMEKDKPTIVELPNSNKDSVQEEIKPKTQETEEEEQTTQTNQVPESQTLEQVIDEIAPQSKIDEITQRVRQAMPEKIIDSHANVSKEDTNGDTNGNTNGSKKGRKTKYSAEQLEGALRTLRFWEREPHELVASVVKEDKYTQSLYSSFLTVYSNEEEVIGKDGKPKTRKTKKHYEALYNYLKQTYCLIKLKEIRRTEPKRKTLTEKEQEQEERKAFVKTIETKLEAKSGLEKPELLTILEETKFEDKFFNEQDLETLSPIYAEKNYKWNSSFRRIFGEDGKAESWYKALPKYILEIEEQRARELLDAKVYTQEKFEKEIKDIQERTYSRVQEIRDFVINKKGIAISRKLSSLSPAEAKKLLEEANLLEKSFDELTLSYSIDNYPFFHNFWRNYSEIGICNWYDALEGFFFMEFKKEINQETENQKPIARTKEEEQKLDERLKLKAKDWADMIRAIARGPHKLLEYLKDERNLSHKKLIDILQRDSLNYRKISKDENLPIGLLKTLPKYLALRLNMSNSGCFIEKDNMDELIAKLDPKSKAILITEQEHAEHSVMPTYKITIYYKNSGKKEFFLKCFEDEWRREYETTVLNFLQEEIFQGSKNNVIPYEKKHKFTNVNKSEMPDGIIELTSSVAQSVSNIENRNKIRCASVAFTQFNKDFDLIDYIEKEIPKKAKKYENYDIQQAIKQIFSDINDILIEIHIKGYDKKEILEKKLNANEELSTTQHTKLKEVKSYKDFVPTIITENKLDNKDRFDKYLEEAHTNFLDDFLFLNKALVHGDCHLKNIRKSKEKNKGLMIFDTDKTHIGIGLQDLVDYANVAEQYGIKKDFILEDYIINLADKTGIESENFEEFIEQCTRAYNSIFLIRKLCDLRRSYNRFHNEDTHFERKQILRKVINKVKLEIYNHAKDNITEDFTKIKTLLEKQFSFYAYRPYDARWLASQFVDSLISQHAYKGHEDVSRFHLKQITEMLDDPIKDEKEKEALYVNLVEALDRNKDLMHKEIYNKHKRIIEEYALLVPEE